MDTTVIRLQRGTVFTAYKTQLNATGHTYTCEHSDQTSEVKMAVHIKTDANIYEITV